MGRKKQLIEIMNWIQINLKQWNYLRITLLKPKVDFSDNIKHSKI